MSQTVHREPTLPGGPKDSVHRRPLTQQRRRTLERLHSMEPYPPLLLHFDVNKTIVQSDSVQDKNIEDGLREGIAELFWGYVKGSKADGKTWDWDEGKISGDLPEKVELNDGVELMTYSQFCKEVVKDKAMRKQATKSYSLVKKPACTEAMESLLQAARDKMLMPPELCFTPEVMNAGLKGTTVVMIPALFHLVANLQQSKRIFAILFRSFGGDHDQIRQEWNCFCEMKHPVFSHLLKDTGPMDGTVPGVPDRRILGIHTLYRDADGPVLMLDTFTNGPEDATWDAWVKQKPKPKVEGRKGREYIKNVLKCECVEGHDGLQGWLKEHLMSQRTGAVKDDWAWWTWNGEREDAGKLLLLLDTEEGESTRQIFYDDNVEHDSSRIVDCRNTDGSAIPQSESLDRLCTKVNSVEALLNNNYFLEKLQKCHNERVDAKASIEDYERQLAELKNAKMEADRKFEALKKEMQSVVEENRRMKLLQKINIRDEQQLRDLITKAGIADNFGKESFKSIADLWKELDNGHCWLETDENGALVRVMEMCFLKIKFKEYLLIESHEQDSDKIQSRNYLAGARKTLKDQTFKETIDRFFQTGLQVDLRSVITNEILPIFVPDAPDQPTLATMAYPIKCKVQQSEATYFIKEKEVENNKELFSKIGLTGQVPKHFTTEESQELLGTTVTHFWRWDKVASWEAMSSRMSKRASSAQVIDIALVCEKLFRGHPRREIYENLLLQMFETFTAKKIAGGFSGSLVIRVQPYESGGRLSDPCIVKMDSWDAIQEEYMNSVAVFEALPDRAARIIGDAVHAGKEGEKFGAMRLELAGACWNVPELAQGAGNLLSTFKDLLLYESEQCLLGKNDTGDGSTRPFGNTNSILAETFGPGGIVASLRKGGSGLHRHQETPLLWGWYTLKGKVSKYNPYNASADEYPPAPAMKRLYKKYFGTEMPDLKAIVVDKIKPMLQDMGKKANIELFPLVGLAHGDLNAANIMIDALDAVWLIDFATSVQLPLFTDMCKFEMACLFEYASIPITPELLVEFASKKKEMWSAMNVGDWLRIDQDIAVLLLSDLVALGEERLAAMNQSMLDKIIEEVAAKSGRAPHKQPQVIRALKSRLVPNEALMDCAFHYCSVCSPALLQGDFLTDALHIQKPQPPMSHAVAGAASLRFFMEMCVSVRRLMAQDMMGLLRAQGTNLQPVDGMCLQLWLPFLRESYRIIGYRDISPQQKIWSIYHCSIVADLVLRTLETLNQNWSSLRTLPIMDKMKRAISKSEEKNSSKNAAEKTSENKSSFTEAESLWFFANRNMFPQNLHMASIVRKVHAKDPLNKDKPGMFAPVLEVQHDGSPQLLLFDMEDTGPAAGEWSLYMANEQRRDKNSLIGTVNAWIDERQPVTLPTVGIGAYTSPPQPSVEPDLSPGDDAASSYPGTPTSMDTIVYSHKVHLKSRLMSMPSEMVKERMDSVMMNVPMDQRHFSIGAWSGGIISDNVSRREHRTDRKGRRASLSSSSDLSLQQYIHLDCVAISPDGRSKMDIKLVLGIPICCYPAGSKLACEQNNMPQGMPWFPEMVVWSLQETGFYKLRDVQNPDKEIDHEFHPQPYNHVYLEPSVYRVGQRVIFVRDQHSWHDGTVVEVPTPASGWRYAIQLSNEDEHHNDDALGFDMGLSLQSSNDLEKDADSKSGPAVYQACNSMNSGVMQIPTAVFEDELNKVRSNIKARHSFLIDALSGMRLEVKECAMPTLTLTSPALPPPPQANEAMPQPRSGTNRTRVMSIVGRNPRERDSGDMADIEQKAPDKKAGWSFIMAAIERYDKKEPSVWPNAFLVMGLPGSGKTCLVTRVIVDCLEKQRNFIPVLVPIPDLLKKIAQAADSFDPSSADPSVFFEMYLRTVFGEDSQRYKTIIQARRMHRVMWLFQGLEGAGSLGSFIEKMIQDLIYEKHLILITSRPFQAGSFSLEKMPGFVTCVQIEKFSDEQKHWVAQVRLGTDGLKTYEKFVKQLQESQLHSEGHDSEEREEQEDVFGNPMMLSMLLVYLQMRQKKKEEAEADGKMSGDSDDSVTLSAVYRVAIEVMLARAQSKAQAERHNKEEKMEQCKRILERMAMEMQIRRTQELHIDEVTKIIPEHLQDSWTSLKGAVAAGHAMFLRMPGGGNNLRFFVKGFQNYFSACQVVHDMGEKLPPLEPLLTDSWWAQMLEMLADTGAHTFVSFIEQGVKNFEPKKGWSFLHIAASVGHRPIFQLFEFFQESTRAALWSKNEDLSTPLHVAAEKGNTHLCRLMIDHKALMDVEDKHGCLPMHVAMQNGHFVTGKYLLDRWIAQNGTARLDVKSNKAEELAQRVLNKELSEEEFLKAVEWEFVELQYYGNKEFKTPGLQALGALLSAYWVCGDHYAKFVRCQPENNRLTQQSWTKLQTWAREDVELTRDASVFGAMLMFMCIINVGKIIPFRKTFAPGYDDPAEALAHVLRHYPILMPSFSRLSEDLQQMILFSTRADFNFGQFLQAENLPANLQIIKGILSEGSRSNNVFGFFLFRIFAAMCGLRAAQTLEGSLMMVDNLFCNFKLGLDVLNHLKDESAQDVSARFLAAKAEVLKMPYNSQDPSCKALIRMLVLCRVLKSDAVADIANAWKQLDEETRNGLVKCLNADGIVQKPGFILTLSPQFMDDAKQNPAVGALRAMKMLLRVYHATHKEYSDSKQPIVTVFLNELAAYAKASTDAEVFDFTRFEIARQKGPKAEIQASVVISPWKLVNDQSELDKIQEQREQLVHKVTQGGIREVAFSRRLEDCFPELSYFSFSGDSRLLKQTKGALLSIYWTVTDQAEAFTRGHHPDEKLSEASWASITEPVEQYLEQIEVLEAMLVACAVMNLGRIKKFQEQLAPGVEGHRDVLKYVMDKCPKVLPSYYCLGAQYSNLVRTALITPFNFLHFLNAENVAFNLTHVKKMMSEAKGQNVLGDLVPFFYILVNFAEIAGSMGDQSLEGSLYMTEERFGLFKLALEAMSKVSQDSVNISDVYIEFLERRAQGLGMKFDKSDPESRCITRIASLCRCNKPAQGQQVADTFRQLREEERSTLTRYMNADGILQKPAFVLPFLPEFLQVTWHNKEVGLLPALRTLLRICERAAKELGGSPQRPTTTIEVYFEKLTTFAKEFLGSVAFDDVPFELMTHKSGVMVVPKAWIPVTNEAVLESLSRRAMTLASGLLDDNQKNVGESDFKRITGRIYPETSYFTANTPIQREQTHGAMLSVYWLITGNHDAFIRQQPEEEQLSKQSWAWIQEWMQENVKLNTAQAVDAALVFMAIHALGKIPEFRDELAPNLHEAHHDVVLARILRHSPEVVPSYVRLNEQFQRLIVDSLSVDFQFAQFLQAENVPANLEVVKEVLEPHGEEGFAFFCFRIFATMCGRLGYKSLEGSLFMTEAQFQRFRPGLEALERLRKLDASSAYKTFLLQRASKTLVRFASSEHHAIARLLCLCSAFDHESGDNVVDAFDMLSPNDKASLTTWLCSDGITSCPGYVLSEVSNLVAQAQANHAVGLVAALQMLAKVQSVCEKVVRQSPMSHKKVIVQLEDVVIWTKECGPDPYEFVQAAVSVRPITEFAGRTEALVLRVEVSKPSSNSPAPQRANGVHPTASFRGTVPVINTDTLMRDQTHIAGPTSPTSPPPRVIAQQTGLVFKPPSRTRHLAQVLKAQRRKQAEGQDESGTVTRL